MNHDIAKAALDAATVLDRVKRLPETELAPVEELARMIEALRTVDVLSPDIDLASIVSRCAGEEPRFVSELRPALDNALKLLRSGGDQAMRFCLDLHAACLAADAGYAGGDGLGLSALAP